jgi:hypothetical protein
MPAPPTRRSTALQKHADPRASGRAAYMWLNGLTGLS